MNNINIVYDARFQLCCINYMPDAEEKGNGHNHDIRVLSSSGFPLL